ncbi:hypothetical protein EDD98_4891 [Streptomyces sp. PanSC19]|uniref:hypothetical protein n=1 Tax=Streptomyces sp. PanSC19 TaxID=1520455 RepID=UPI000FBAD42E|nr:hypothetical protein [Streptomyces sp. PanSC19]ROQ35815.1 hypothetical protein EDD98_4891 [Streptomyces sp. PanSC19]
MASGVYHTKCGITINPTFEDLGHPDRPGLLEEITQPVGKRDRDLLQCLTDHQGGDCQCALADKTPWVSVRRCAASPHLEVHREQRAILP